MNLHSPSKSNTKQIPGVVHKFLALFWYVCIARLAISTRVYFAKNVAYFPLILDSVLSDCVVFYGDRILSLSFRVCRSQPVTSPCFHPVASYALRYTSCTTGNLTASVETDGFCLFRDPSMLHKLVGACHIHIGNAQWILNRRFFRQIITPVAVCL